MKSSPRQILTNFQYKTAAAFYEQHGCSSFLKDLFAKGQSSYTEKKLREEIEKLANETVETTAEKNTNSSTELQLEKEWKPHYKKANYYHTQLHHCNTDQERKTLAFNILNTMDQVKSIWRKRDYYQKHHRLPPNKEEFNIENLDVFDLHKKLKTLNTYLSRYRNKNHTLYNKYFNQHEAIKQALTKLENG